MSRSMALLLAAMTTLPAAAAGQRMRADLYESTAPRTLSAKDAIALYARGECDAAVQGLITQGLRARQFTRTLDTWTAEGDPTSLPRRRRIAAAFSLDAGWHATRTPFNITSLNRDPWGHQVPKDSEEWWLASSWSQPIVAQWALEQLASSPARDATGRTLTLAAVGLAEDGHAWNRLQHAILPLARTLLGDDPRLRLADVLARTNSDLGPLRTDPAGSSAARIGALRHESLPRETDGRIARALAAFRPLLGDPALAGEVELRMGYLEMRRRHWSAALARFDAARRTSADPLLQAAADYFAGWVHEQQEKTDDAIAAYRRAHAITPLMRNLTTRLAALLFLKGERAEAYRLLDAALNARPAPTDLLVVVERADARFVPEWLTAIRQAIR